MTQGKDMSLRKWLRSVAMTTACVGMIIPVQCLRADEPSNVGQPVAAVDVALGEDGSLTGSRGGWIGPAQTGATRANSTVRDEHRQRDIGRHWRVSLSSKKRWHLLARSRRSSGSVAMLVARYGSAPRSDAVGGAGLRRRPGPNSPGCLWVGEPVGDHGGCPGGNRDPRCDTQQSRRSR